MPAINVAKSDTFEIQRQKINQIGSIVSNISAGGSDLQTGNLKLGDGSIGVPSLSFINDAELGLFRSQAKTIEMVSGGKKIWDFSEESTTSYKNLGFLKEVLKTDGLIISNGGTNYDPGSYSGLNVLGGTGVDATINLSVTAYTGTITNPGAGYETGIYNEVLLVGGSGTGSVGNIVVSGIEGEITNAGSAYKPGSYSNVSIINGTGTNAIAEIEVQGESTISGSITNGGSGYDEGEYPEITILNQPVQTFTVTTTSNPSSPPSNLLVIDGTTQQALTLVGGNTYKFDVSDSSMVGYSFGFRTLEGDTNLDLTQYQSTTKGGGGGTNAAVYLTVKPGASTQIEYYAIEEEGMGATVSFTSGSQTNYGTGGTVTVTVNASNQISNVTWVSTGQDYNIGDGLEFSAYDIGFTTTASGATYNISNITYSGVVFSVNFTSIGQGYLNGDVVSANDSDLGGGGGSGFAFTIQSNPGTVSQLDFNNKGTGYVVDDILSLPTAVTGKTTTLSGQVLGIQTTLSTASSTITVSDTTGIIAGMAVTVEPGGVGDLNFSTVVQSVNSGTSLTLNPNPVLDGAATLNFAGPNDTSTIIVDDVTGISTNAIVTQTAGTGTLAAGTTVISINSEENSIVLSTPADSAGSATLTFTPPFGTPTTNFEFTIDTIGVVDGFSIAKGGIGYSIDDVITVNPTDVTQPFTYVVTVIAAKLVTFSGGITSGALQVGDEMVTTGGGFGDPETTSIYYIKESGGTVDYIIIGPVALSGGDTLQNSRTNITYTTNTVEDRNRFLFDGEILSSPTTFYVGNTYVFDTTNETNGGHPLRFSAFPDGPYTPSNVELSATYSNQSAAVTVASTTGILVGMGVNITDFTSGVLIPSDTIVESIDGPTSLTLSNIVSGSGAATTAFAGKEYTDGVVTSDAETRITITDVTPDLYIYCENHENMAGEDGDEIRFEINPNNPKVFGSGLALTVTELDVSTPIDVSIKEEKITVNNLATSSITFDTAVGNTSISVPSVTSTSVTAEELLSTDKISVTATNGVVFNSGISIQDSSQNVLTTLSSTNGKFFTTGEIESSQRFNSNDKLFIENENISSATNTDINLIPSVSRIVKVDTNTALIIPSGNNDQRPTGAGQAENGAIRFNTESQQYEGYSENTDSWSSLGGVRDLDGNTTILAEETIGANDNTLWFINDNVNTLKFTPQYQEFTGVKKIRSVNTSAPLYEEWTANTPVNAGDYLKYRNNIYLVVSTTGDGSTATSGNEPTDTSGDPFVNGNTTLQFYTTAVAPLTFEEISEVRIDPLGFTSLVINNELRFSQNNISSAANDIVIEPYGSQKVVIDCESSLVVPVGDNNSKGNPAQGSIRYNTTDTQFEGFNGTQWGGLGGVKDIDQDTKIEAETGPGNDEDILYFFNAGDNTLRLTTTELVFNTIDTIQTSSSNFNINASLVTFDNLATSIDNTSSTSSFISCSKDNLDFGLATGIFNDHLLRLTDTGTVIYNLGFSTGTPNNLTVLNNNLTNFELLHTKVNTFKLNLIKGTTNSANGIIYNPSTEASGKVVVTAHNTTTGDKEVTEFLVVDKGSDIFYTDFNNLKTGASLISTEFDFDPNNKVRITFNLDANLTSGDTIQITVVNTITKR